MNAKTLLEFTGVRIRKFKALILGRRLSFRYFPISFAGNKFFLPISSISRPVCQSLLEGKTYEALTVSYMQEWLRRNPGSIVHAGAYIGDMLPAFSRLVPRGSFVYSFEPVLESYILAKLAISANALANVYLLNAGLSNQVRITAISTACRGVNLGGGSYISDSSGDELIPTLTLDILGLNGISVVHLDIEGHELPALIGARHLLESQRPLLIIEDRMKNCSSFLESIGYTLQSRIDGNSVYTCDIS